MHFVVAVALRNTRFTTSVPVSQITVVTAVEWLFVVVPLCENLHSEFANFVLKRAVAGEILERLLTFDLSLDELIDKYFVPYKEATSDVSNLWIIDENLAYPYQRISLLQDNYF